MPKILVIDDEAMIREATREALARQGFETHEAPDGASGLELARRVVPDLVLCDVMMEPMDGYATLAALRQDTLTAAIPFILMTGMARKDTMRQGMNLGADDFLEKPFTASQLFSAINARLHKQQTLRATAEKKLAELRASLSLALPHEMNTPLHGIVGLAHTLITASEQLAPEDISDIGQDILRSAERLEQLVKNFLLYGELEMAATDPARVAELRQKRSENTRQIVTERVTAAAAKARRAADAQVDAADATLAIAPEMFAKVVEELLDNAFKFSSIGQSVRVTGAIVDGEYLLVVIDQGEGMEPEQIARIGAYSQFNRRTREQQGSGLGLAIVKRLTELHGGSFDIASERGAGAAVTVRLPVAPTSDKRP